MTLGCRLRVVVKVREYLVYRTLNAMLRYYKEFMVLYLELEDTEVLWS